MRTQLEFLKEAVTLAEANPDLAIHFCADSDELMESMWTMHQITKIEIRPWFEDDEHIYTDEDEIKEHFENVFDGGEGFEPTEQEISEQVNARYAKEVKLAICIYTQAG